MGALRVMMEGLSEKMTGPDKGNSVSKGPEAGKSLHIWVQRDIQDPRGGEIARRNTNNQDVFSSPCVRCIFRCIIWCFWRWSLLWTPWSWFSSYLGRLKLNTSFCPSSHRCGGHGAVHQHGGESLLRDAGWLGEHEGEAILNGPCRSGVCSSHVPSPPPRWPRLSEPLP